MTIVVVILIGAGTLLIASALDCTPIVSTFQKIVSGQAVDWTGQANQCGQQVTNVPQTTNPTGKNTQPGTISTKGTQCPSGYTFVPIAGGTTGTCVKTG